MITDLHSGPVSPRLWGPKAGNLALLVSHGILVPPGLCFWPHIVRAAARDLALDAWLMESRAGSLIVRSSTANEDGHETAGAGRSSSLPSVAPDRRSVVEAVEAVTASAERAGHDLRSVIIQQEVLTTSSGVAFAWQTGDLLVEADPARFAVTGGSPVSIRARIDPKGVVALEQGSFATAEVRAIASAAASCAAALGSDLDIEWGYLAGAVYVFQARPITRAVDG